MYKEPLKTGIKISPYWIKAITSALSRKHDIKIMKGNTWAVNIEDKVLIYTEDISYLDKETALALLLHEIGHIKHTDDFDTKTEIWKKAPEASKLSVNAIEDIRIDWTMAREYGNSWNIIEQLHDTTIKNGIKELETYNENVKKSKKYIEEFKKEDAKNQELLKQGKLDDMTYAGWRDQVEKKMPKLMNPVREAMWIALANYYDYKVQATKDYHNPKIPEVAEKVVENMRINKPEYLDSTKEVQDYYETEIYPIVKELIETDENGNEKPTENHPGSDSQQQQSQSSSPQKQQQKGNGQPDEDKSREFAQRIRKELQKQADELGTGKLPGREEPPINEDVDYEAYYEQIKGSINTSAHRFSRVLKDNAYDRLGGRFKSGELNQKRLYKSRLNEQRLFQRKIVRQNKDYAFSVMLDCSGSMSGTAIEESMKGIALLSEVFNKTHIPFEVCFFSTRHVFGKRFQENFSRRKMSQEATKVWNGGTTIIPPFKESIEALARHKARKKVMITLTDGEVSGNEENQCRELIHKNKDILCYGIGIGANLDKIFESNFISIEDANEISTRFMAILKRHIKTG